MKTTKLLILISVIIISLGISNMYSIFNPLSVDDWKDLGEKALTTFEKGFNFLGKTFNNVRDFVNDAFQRLTECASIAGLGAKWAAQRAAYEAAESSLDVANKSLDAAKASAQGFNKVLDGLANAAGKGINIKKMSFEAYTSKLLQGQGPRVTFEATILGKDIKKDMTLDLSKPLDAAKTLAKDIIDQIKI